MQTVAAFFWRCRRAFPRECQGVFAAGGGGARIDTARCPCDLQLEEDDRSSGRGGFTRLDRLGGRVAA